MEENPQFPDVEVMCCELDRIVRKYGFQYVRSISLLGFNKFNQDDVGTFYKKGGPYVEYNRFIPKEDF